MILRPYAQNKKEQWGKWLTLFEKLRICDDDVNRTYVWYVYVVYVLMLCVVSTRRRVPTNWVSGRTLQASIESVVASSFVPSDFLVDGQASGLGTVHPLLTLSFFSTWFLPLHVVAFSTLKRKSSSSVMDGLQRERDLCILKNIIIGDQVIDKVHKTCKM